MIEINYEEKLNTLINICILITFIFSIVLIIDELYNIIKFSFNYTHLYNLGSFTEKFNKDKTIEMETKRFNVYNNIENLVLHKDIYNKSYLNYFIIVSITIITLLFVVSYGLYFYEKFIKTQYECTAFTEKSDYHQMSIIKKFIYCLKFLKPLNSFIPNCTINYFVLLFIIIIMPITYILKLLFNYDVKSVIIKYSYLIVYLMLLLYYSFKYYNELSTVTTDANGVESSDKDIVQKMIIYVLFTILFISSQYIYNYVYDKYNGDNLISKFDKTTFFDIYKQIAPTKPSPINKPQFNGNDILKTFTYSSTETNDPNYLTKKKLVDDYYVQLKKYNEQMDVYNEKYDIYKQSKNKLPQNLDIISVPYNMIGFNDNFIMYLHFLVTVAFLLDYYYKNEIINYNCLIYLISVLIIITLMNCVVYYNTYLNKYIIYEPMAQYKSDISVVNTKLNLILTDNHGQGFYNALTNNNNSSNNDLSDYDLLSGYANKNTIIQEIKNISYNYNKYNFTSASNINQLIIRNNSVIDTSSSTKNVLLTDNIELCYLVNSSINGIDITTGDDAFKYFIKNIDILYVNKQTPVKLIKFINLYYNKQYITLQTNYERYYMVYYYMIKQYVLIWNTYYSIISDSGRAFTKKEGEITVLVSALQELNDTELYNYSFDNFAQQYFDDKYGNGSYQSYTRIIEQLNIDSGSYKTYITTKLGPNLQIVNNTMITNISNYGIELSNIYYSNTFSNVSLQHKKIAYILEKTDSTGKDNYNTFPDVKLINPPIPSTADTNNLNIILSSIPNYYKLPSRIIDNNNNEYSIKINYATFFTSGHLSNLYLIQPNVDDSHKNKIINSFNIYQNTNSILYQKEKLSSDIDETLDGFKYHDTNKRLQYTKSTFQIPDSSLFIPYYVYSTPRIDHDDNSKIKHIVYDVIVNSLVNVINTNITSTNAQLYNKFDVISNPNKNIKFNDKFNANNNYNINKSSELINTFLKFNISTKDYTSLIVLIYNIMIIDVNKIDNLIDTINYLVNMNDPTIYTQGTYDFVNKNRDILNNSIYLNQDNRLNAQNTIKNAIIDNKYNNSSLIVLYNKNIHIIKLILQLFSNMLTYIKTNELRNIDKTLCSKIQSKSLNKNIDDVEKFVKQRFTTITSKDAPVTCASENELYSTVESNNTAKSFNNISNNITHFLNMTLFLLNNLSSSISDDTNAVIKNYNFFNSNIMTNNDLIKKQLSIDCNYFNKYYNMNNKDNTYMHNNIKNVSYNFIVLVVAFSVIIFEPMLIIKS
jgi:hypothetical protein